MIAFPNAKINLGLNILEKRPDGFHNIETVFYPIEWCDMLEVIKAQNEELKTNRPAIEKIEFHSTGNSIDVDLKSNLCFKAFKILDDNFNLGPTKIFLHKIIPMGAGLGGGSSDAAFTLKLLNKVYELNLIEQQLFNYAGTLGSDCAFFIHNKPAFASGRGEVLEEINLSLRGKYIVLVKPDASVATTEAYSMIAPSFPVRRLKEIIQLPIDQWKTNLKNDFEESVSTKYPIIQEIKNHLYKMGAVYSSMSGSGSSVFGIFETPPILSSMFKNHLVYQGKLK